MDHRVIIVLAALLATAPAFGAWDDNGFRVVATTEGSHADVVGDLEQAIIGRGLVVSTVARVGEMLERTAADLGFTASPFVAADVVEFCSAPLTRKMTDADPSAVVQCPYRIAVYTLAAQPGTVHLAYAKPTAAGKTPELEAVEALLRGLVEELL